MDRSNLIALLARTLAADYTSGSDQPPTASVATRHWRQVIQLARLDEPEQQAYHPLFTETWDRTVERLWTRRQTANPDFGKRLKELVEQSGYSVQELAEQFHLTRQYFYKVFNNQTNTSVDMLCRMLNAVGARWGDLDYPEGLGP